MRSLKKSVFALFPAILLAAACGGGGANSSPPHLDIPVPPMDSASASASGTKSGPPPSTASKPSPFPAVTRGKTQSGLAIAVAEAHTLPIVQLRLMVRAGAGFGGPSVAALTAEMLKEGGTKTTTSARFLEKLESIGASLDVEVDQDRTVFSVGVTKSHAADAVALLAEMITTPRFDAGELKKLKARFVDDATEAVHASGQFMAMRVLYRELFAETNPYAIFGSLPSEIAKITEAQVRAFHAKYYVPANSELVVCGDVTLDEATKLAEPRFASWKGTLPPQPTFPPAIAPAGVRVLVAHRAKSTQSDVFVAKIAPPRNAPDWADLRVANHVLGGGVASRLFLDVREQRSLAYQTRSSIQELKNGPQPLVAYAGTQTAKTTDAVQGILENIEKIAQSGVDASETESATRYLSDVFAIRLETVGAIADYVVLQDAFNLGDGYWDKYRTEIRTVDAARASAAAKKLFGPAAGGTLIVVAGDADVIAAPLAKYGEVTIVDPEKDFKTVKTVPKAP
ncbi:pitrilysin family protein [soil metagenome]